MTPTEETYSVRCSQCSAALADLLGQLALRGLQRRLALHVEPARRDLEEVGIVGDLARLAHEEEVGAVVGDDADGALVADDLALDLLAVGVAVALDAQRDDAALVDGAAPEGLEAAVGGGHRRSVAYGAGPPRSGGGGLGAHVRVDRRPRPR